MRAGIKVRPGDVETDSRAVIGLLSSHLNPAYDRQRFDWVYQRNPAGPGRFWVAVDDSTGELIGTAGALPRELCVAGARLVGWVLTDFCISETHRSLGPALQLQRACLEQLAADGARVWYDFPGRGMEAVYRRLGVSSHTSLRRFVRPLRTYAKLRERLGSSLLARPASIAADLALAWTTRTPKSAAAVGVAIHSARCGEEFTALARRESPQRGLCVWRSAEYLNWRYRDNPIQPHDLVTARCEGRLVAYAALTRDTEAPTLVDLFGEGEPLRALIATTVSLLRTRGAMGVNAWLRDSHPWAALLQALGFRPRETAPVIVGFSAGSSCARAIEDGGWFLTYGDRDT